MIRGARVDTANRLIYIDTAPSGITLQNFKSLVSFKTHNAATSATEVTNGNVVLGKDDLVPTGAAIKVTASGAGGSETVTYTVIVLGDTNCNGKIESGDATRIAFHYVGSKLLTGYAYMAADTTCNGIIDAGDAVNLSTKYVYKWDDKTYVSALK